MYLLRIYGKISHLKALSYHSGIERQTKSKRSRLINVCKLRKIWESIHLKYRRVSSQLLVGEHLKSRLVWGKEKVNILWKHFYECASGSSCFYIVFRKQRKVMIHKHRFHVKRGEKKKPSAIIKPCGENKLFLLPCNMTKTPLCQDVVRRVRKTNKRTAALFLNWRKNTFSRFLKTSFHYHLVPVAFSTARNLATLHLMNFSSHFAIKFL